MPIRSAVSIARSLSRSGVSSPDHGTGHHARSQGEMSRGGNERAVDPAGQGHGSAVGTARAVGNMLCKMFQAHTSSLAYTTAPFNLFRAFDGL